MSLMRPEQKAKIFFNQNEENELAPIAQTESPLSSWGKSDFFMLLAVAIWGVNLTVIKFALTEFPGHIFNFLRLVGASIILFVFLFWQKESLSLSLSQWLRIIFVGFLGNTFYQLLFIKGISLTTASNASLIMTSSPIFIALLSTLFRQEKLSGYGWLGLFLSFFGLYLVITQRSGGFSFSSYSLRGDLMILLANLGWAGYTIFSRPLLAVVSPLKMATMTLAAGAVFYLPFGLMDLNHFSGKAISWKGWSALVFSFVFALGVSFIIWYKSLQSVGNSRTSVYSYLTPLLAIVTAHLVLGERISFIQALGGLIILLGFSLTRSGAWWQRRIRRPSEIA